MGDFTQDDGYVRGLTPTHDVPSDPCSNNCYYSQVLKVPDTDTGTGPIPPVTVFRVKSYNGGVLARELPEGLLYLST
jgi:hypothetical protein